MIHESPQKHTFFLQIRLIFTLVDSFSKFHKIIFKTVTSRSGKNENEIFRKFFILPCLLYL